MDRNNKTWWVDIHTSGSLSARRAWIEITPSGRISGRTLSLSARRAWIEISALAPKQNPTQVALRKESVDRNVPALRLILVLNMSLSARRAWIEITHA